MKTKLQSQFENVYRSVINEQQGPSVYAIFDANASDTSMDLLIGLYLDKGQADEACREYEQENFSDTGYGPRPYVISLPTGGAASDSYLRSAKDHMQH